MQIHFEQLHWHTKAKTDKEGTKQVPYDLAMDK